MSYLDCLAKKFLDRKCCFCKMKKMNDKKIFILFLILCLFCVLNAYATAPYITYTVKKGDTFSSIARKYNVTVNDIIKENSTINIKNLKVSTLVKIPINKNKSNSKNRSFKIILGDSSLKYKHSLKFPLKEFKKISSKFGYRWKSFHEGIDISATRNTNIYASHAGRVVYSSNRMSGYGNTIVIKGDGIMTVYAHNNRNLVHLGESVETGERIGLVGSTGRAEGPHLHFETRVKVNGKWYAVSPFFFLP